MTSHVRGTRCSGSKASKVCNTVVPLRGKPTMKSGSRISCRTMPGYAFRSRCMNKREHNMRTRSARRTILPIRLSWASRWQESINREMPSKNSPPPKSSRPQRRFAGPADVEENGGDIRTPVANPGERTKLDTKGYNTSHQTGRS